MNWKFPYTNETTKEREGEKNIINLYKMYTIVFKFRGLTNKKIWFDTVKVWEPIALITACASMINQFHPVT